MKLRGDIADDSTFCQCCGSRFAKNIDIIRPGDGEIEINPGFLLVKNALKIPEDDMYYKHFTFHIGDESFTLQCIVEDPLYDERGYD